MEEYISKKKILDIIEQAYDFYLPSYHSPIHAIETAINAEETLKVVRAKWLISHKHMWELAEDGLIDEFAWENGVHNGPRCTLCYRTPCVNCEPNWENLETCHKIHYECSNCGKLSRTRELYCSCGALMDK